MSCGYTIGVGVVLRFELCHSGVSMDFDQQILKPRHFQNQEKKKGRGPRTCALRLMRS